MAENLEQVIQDQKKSMESSVEYLAKQLSQVRTGKANPSVMDNVRVDYYGAETPLPQVANVSTSDSRTIVIQPWEKSMIEPIEKAIFGSNLGLTPQNDGDVIRISIPQLTEERRKELVKQCNSFGEDAKVSIRSARHRAMDAIKKEVKDGYPKDAADREEEKIDAMTAKYSKKVDDIIDAKESEIMKV
ncbi:MAG: ribosome recycling factor [Bacteroidetes bacterium]|jgi:ribosome recycling factor|nr:ribosome recycling factor [Bacteroidota bacterium]